MKNKCAICEKDLNVFNRKKISDGYVCVNCGVNKSKLSGDELRTLSSRTISQVKDRIKRVEDNADRRVSFVATKKIGNYLYLDENKKRWLVPGSLGSIKKAWIFDFSDIIEFELLENGGSVSSGGIGRAVVGGILLGGVGAVVGGLSGGRSSVVNNLQVKITTKDMDNPAIYINFITGGASYKTRDFIYKQLFKKAQNIMSTLSVIVDSEHVITVETIPASRSSNNISELREYKQLLDEGIITEDEFNIKKKDLLS